MSEEQKFIGKKVKAFTACCNFKKTSTSLVRLNGFCSTVPENSIPAE